MKRTRKLKIAGVAVSSRERHRHEPSAKAKRPSTSFFFSFVLSGGLLMLGLAINSNVKIRRDLMGVRLRDSAGTLMQPSQHHHEQSNHTIVLAGIVQNVPGEHLRNHIPKMIRLGQELAGSSSGKFHILIYENDSGPDTRNTLYELLHEKPYASYVYEDTLRGETSRTDRIASARNRLLEEWERHLLTQEDDYDFLLIMDMDGVCGGEDSTLSYDSSILQYALSRHSEWEGIFFRFVPYWDLWAFRHPVWMPENRAGPHASQNLVANAQQLDEKIDAYNRTELIPVQSAFMMMGIYKTRTVKGMQYAGKGIHGEMDCEHVAFHKALREQRQARLRLLPMVYCQGDPGYFPLEQQKAM